MSKKYLLAEHTIERDDIKDLVEWLKQNPWLTQGELVREFEQTYARWSGHRFAVFVNSGSSANLLMYAALLARESLANRKVIVPAIAWATTVAPAIQLGFEPIMCDADEQTFGLDLGQLEALLRQHGAATVIIVHVLGVPNDMEGLLALKKRYGFQLLEDSCAAMGTRYDGKHVGTFGDMASYSFYFGHHLSTIEGGMICTDDESTRDMLLMLRSHGWTKDLSAEEQARMAEAHHVIPFNRTFTFYVPGYNVRSTDLNARIGLSQMKKADRVVARRVENHKTYQSRFIGAAGLHCQQNPRGTISSISFCALASSASHRDRIGAALARAGIETRPIGGGNMSRQPFWASRFGSTDMRVADRIHTTGFQLPNHPGLSTEDIHHISDTVLAVSAT